MEDFDHEEDFVYEEIEEVCGSQEDGARAEMLPRPVSSPIEDIDLKYSRENNLEQQILSDDVKVKIIQAVKKYPCLFHQRKDTNYKSLIRSKDGWRDVAREVNSTTFQNLQGDACCKIFKALLRDFSVIYVILRDEQLMKEGWHRRNVFIYYDHMLFFRNQIDIARVRQNEVQAYLRRTRKWDWWEAHKAKIDRQEAEAAQASESASEADEDGKSDGAAALEFPKTELGEILEVTDVDLAYIRDNNLSEKILPDDKNVKLIEAVKEYPCLYDKTTDNRLTTPAWQQITERTKIKKCKNKFLALFREFKVTFVMLRDPKLVEEGLPVPFIYYEKMLFMINQIDFNHVKKYSVPLAVKRQQKEMRKLKTQDERIMARKARLQSHGESWRTPIQASQQGSTASKSTDISGFNNEDSDGTNSPNSRTSEDSQWIIEVKAREVTCFFDQLAEKIINSSIRYQDLQDLKEEISKIVEKKLPNV